MFGNVTTGAANDIEQATNIVTNMITRFGMSRRFGLMGLATVENEYLGGGARLTCSDRTAADVDTEVMQILKECYEEAKQLLSENRELMDKLAAHLIEKETISGKEFMRIYRKEKGLPEPEEKPEEAQEKKDEAVREKKEETVREKPVQTPGEKKEELPAGTLREKESGDGGGSAEPEKPAGPERPAEQPKGLFPGPGRSDKYIIDRNKKEFLCYNK